MTDSSKKGTTAAVSVVKDALEIVFEVNYYTLSNRQYTHFLKLREAFLEEDTEEARFQCYNLSTNFPQFNETIPFDFPEDYYEELLLLEEKLSNSLLFLSKLPAKEFHYTKEYLAIADASQQCKQLKTNFIRSFPNHLPLLTEKGQRIFSLFSFYLLTLCLLLLVFATALGYIHHLSLTVEEADNDEINGNYKFVHVYNDGGVFVKREKRHGNDVIFKISKTTSETKGLRNISISDKETGDKTLVIGRWVLSCSVPISKESKIEIRPNLLKYRSLYESDSQSSCLPSNQMKCVTGSDKMLKITIHSSSEQSLITSSSSTDKDKAITKTVTEDEIDYIL
jgi:hypothetical protein